MGFPLLGIRYQLQDQVLIGLNYAIIQEAHVEEFLPMSHVTKLARVADQERKI